MTTLCTNLSTMATTQFSNFNFNSFANFNGMCLAADEDGLDRICCGGADGDTEIDASFTVVDTDLGINNPKRMWFMYLAYEADGDLQVTAWADGVLVGTYDIPKRKSGEQRGMVEFGQGAYGRYWTFKFSNKDGADFSIDAVEVLPIIIDQGHG